VAETEISTMDYSLAAPLCVGASAVLAVRLRRRLDAWRSIVVRRVPSASSNASTHPDKEGILTISKGVYIGHDGLSWDYLPYKLEKWFADPNKVMFVAESDDFYCKKKGQIAAFDVVSIYDGGETVMSQALRVGRNYRGIGFATKVSTAGLDFVRKSLPSAKRFRATTKYPQHKAGALILSYYFTI
jgi:hypothetical protein